MSLRQERLHKSEWDYIEVPIDEKEKGILNFMITSYTTGDLNAKANTLLSLINILKLSISPDADLYLYQKFFEGRLNQISWLSVYLPANIPKKTVHMKKADIIRISNQNANQTSWESSVITVFEDFGALSYYKLNKLVTLATLNKNKYILELAESILREEKISLTDIIPHLSDQSIEDDLELYSHQKTLFNTLCISETRHDANLILYVAPTGTGKTLTPIILSFKYRIIFVCAARHVGLSIAKSAISMGKKLAFAFGCESTDDIKLHNSAAVNYNVDAKTGRIYNIDNSCGEKVEMIICDLISCAYAILYMKAFNDVKNILLFWDEPTILLDKETHPLHLTMKETWTNNSIPNVILSSATLPKLSQLTNMEQSFKSKFGDNSNILEICSFDFKKSISLLNIEGFVIMPHFLSEDYGQILQAVETCEGNLTLLRYLDFKEILHFLNIIEELKFSKYNLKDFFNCIDEISMEAVKLFYLKVLKSVKTGCWGSLYLTLKTRRQKMYDPFTGIFLTTADAYTLTDGPTMFLTNDVDKLCKFFLQKSNIPMDEITSLYDSIFANDQIYTRLNEIDVSLEVSKPTSDAKSKSKSVESSVKSSSSSKKDNRETTVLTGLQQKLQNEKTSLFSRLKVVQLSEKYIPNKIKHLAIHHNKSMKTNLFSGEISQSTVVEIMSLNKVSNEMKILLLMGIGVFVESMDNLYLKIMKDLAAEQKLFLIISSSDYIYGTNYQFCHAYLSKDLNLTQQKLIQSLGRVGRKRNNFQYTVRFRDDNYANLLFFDSPDCLEVLNMNNIFN